MDAQVNLVDEAGERSRLPESQGGSSSRWRRRGRLYYCCHWCAPGIPKASTATCHSPNGNFLLRLPWD